MSAYPDFHELARLLRAVAQNQEEQLKNQRKIMSALDSLNAAVTRLQASVDAAVTVLNTPHPTDAAVQAAADAVNAQSDRLDNAVNPPAPVPPPSQ